MNIQYKDYFSEDSAGYGRFRPKYPEQLFTHLASVSNEHQKAWDCATGTGQSAITLSNYFSTVIATDASITQIEKAERKEGVIYRVATAENSGIEEDSIDLITVAQAIHWFDIQAFIKEVKRVLKDNGILSVWTYNLLSVQDDIDEEIFHLYNSVLGEYWPKERKMVEDGYKSIQLPFNEIDIPELNMSARWNLSQLTGYLCTWSAAKEYHKKTGINSVEKIYGRISDMWGKPDKVLPIKWPLSVRVWQKNT